MDKIIKIPIKTSEVIKNQRGNNSVNCIVSNRWLKFSRDSCSLECGEAFTVDVMTTNKNGIDKKICQLIITKEDLLFALNQVKLSNK